MTKVNNSFNLTTGRGVTASRAGGATFGSSTNVVLLTTANFTARTTRVYNVTVTWRFNYEATLLSHDGCHNTTCSAPRGWSAIFGYAFTNVNYSSNGTTVPAGNGTTFGYFIDHLLLGGTGPASHVTTWNQTLDRGVVKMTYLVSLTANTTYFLQTGYRIILFGGSPPALGSSGPGVATYSMGGQGDDHSQLVSITVV
ncbi:MAG: hypothetical protein L3J96_03650 [Thermoplasmata archaeon]|nr:hypothetical protein [Thermoplasmata archaeon]